VGIATWLCDTSDFEFRKSLNSPQDMWESRKVLRRFRDAHCESTTYSSTAPHVSVGGWRHGDSALRYEAKRPERLRIGRRGTALRDAHKTAPE